MTCFRCRNEVVDGELVEGPLCGVAEDHPHCDPVGWHRGCRRSWLEGLQAWGEVAGVEPSPPRLRVVRDQ